MTGTIAIKQTVRVAVRPASIRNPVLVDFQRRGVEIAKIDLTEDSDEQLEAALQGVDTIICTLIFDRIDLQPRLVDVAIKAGVRRFVPSDFGTPGRKGVRLLHDDVGFLIPLIHLSLNVSPETCCAGVYSKFGNSLHIYRCWFLVRGVLSYQCLDGWVY